jgi:hypothetical protein
MCKSGRNARGQHDEHILRVRIHRGDQAARALDPRLLQREFIRRVAMQTQVPGFVDVRDLVRVLVQHDEGNVFQFKRVRDVPPDASVPAHDHMIFKLIQHSRSLSIFAPRAPLARRDQIADDGQCERGESRASHNQEHRQDASAG